MTGSQHEHAHRAHAVAMGRAPRRRRFMRGFMHGLAGWRSHDLRRRTLILFRSRFMLRMLLGSALCFAVVMIAALGLWWRLSSGPIELNLATPWLKAAIEENFGGNHSVAVGGTQLERDEKGRTSLRLRDIVVRDTDGTIVASAPKAEVGLSGRSLLLGRLRAQSLNLVGAEMSVRIETDGRLTVFAGADNRPIATAAPTAGPPAVTGPDSTAPQSILRGQFANLAALMARIDAVGESGLDGHDLRELGLKNGNLVVDDRRNGKQWKFDGINVSLTRPRQGGVIFRLESDNEERPWVISAAMRPLSDGVRAVGIEARKVSTRDIILALRLNPSNFDIDIPLSASVRAEVSRDGSPQAVQGQLVADAGTIVDQTNDKLNVNIDHADFRFNWDNRRNSLIVPFQVQSGGNQFTMRATFEPSTDQSGAWLLNVNRGDSVIDPIIFAPSADEEGLSINRLTVRARIDPTRKRIDLDQGDFSRVDTRPEHNVGVALTGRFDYSGAEPHIAFGVACTRMPVSAMKRIWPIFAAADVRAWALEHISGGMVERAVIAGNAPLEVFKHDGPPTPDDGLSIDIETSGTTVRPIPTLPAIRDADLTVRIVGRNAVVNIGRGTAEAATGRKLKVGSGVFEVPDTPPTPAWPRVALRRYGTMPATAALLSSERLRDTVGIALDPASTRGTVTAQVGVNMLLGRTAPKDNATYTINADLVNFAAEKMLLGQKVEASLLKANATKDGFQIKGDVKINGTPATIDVRKQKDDTDAELHMQATFDEAARRRLGMDLGSAVTGNIPVKVVGHVNNNVTDEGLNIEADLTPVKIDNLLPGWVKAAGRPARASYVLMKNGKSARFDDLSIDGSGATVRGSIEFDSNNEISAANFPVFALSEGDKATLKADRAGDGTLRVAMRGDIYDGRNFVKSSMTGASADKNKAKQVDLDLDVKLGTVAGHNGETLRGLDLKMSRRGGHIRTFAMSSKIGRDTPLNGDLRMRSRDNHQVIFFETDDAGALFRFTDMYPRMYGGQMWVAMNPPTQEQTPQIGTLFIRRFVVRGEPALEKVVSGAPNAAGTSGVDFSEMRADFTRFTGKMAVRAGVVRGPLVGATVEGNIDYTRDEVYLRGTCVPFYGLNNMFGQIPIVGLFLGGGNKEGLLGITYEAVGPPSAPRITVNPVSAIAPGLLRKFIPSPGTFDPNFLPPSR